MEVDDKQLECLVDDALRARQRAYAPYSNFLVGAAVLAESGRIYTGCNVENASYGLAICAERSAITTMVAEGDRKIKAMVVTCSGAGSPCGACRQVMAEFGDEAKVYLVDADTAKVASVWTIRDLLPSAFKLSQRNA